MAASTYNDDVLYCDLCGDIHLDGEECPMLHEIYGHANNNQGNYGYGNDVQGNYGYGDVQGNHGHENYEDFPDIDQSFYHSDELEEHRKLKCEEPCLNCGSYDRYCTFCLAHVDPDRAATDLAQTMGKRSITFTGRIVVGAKDTFRGEKLGGIKTLLYLIFLKERCWYNPKLLVKNIKERMKYFRTKDLSIANYSDNEKNITLLWKLALLLMLEDKEGKKRIDKCGFIISKYGDIKYLVGGKTEDDSIKTYVFAHIVSPDYVVYSLLY